MKTKHLILVLSWLLILLNLFTMAAQNVPFITESFSIKKGTETLAEQQTEIYFTQIVKLSTTNQDGCYAGTLGDMYFTRKGINKYIYSIDYTIKPVIQSAKVTLYFGINGINQRTIVCDRTQKETSGQIALSEMSKELKSAFADITDDISDCLRDYLKKGEEKSPRLARRPYWYPLNYVVEESSVSYYQILTSEKGLCKEDIYKVFENYFTYAYRSGKAVIENKNAHDCSIIAKGIYAEVHRYSNFSTEDYDVPHVVSVQCRDGRARVTITIGNYDIHRTGNKYVSSGNFTRNIAEYEPFGSERDEEMEECLEKLEARILAQFVDMKKAMDEGNTAVDALDDW